MKTEMGSSGIFDHLIGSSLCAITFIWNYFQFLIGTETISVYSAPIVHAHGKTFSYLDAEYRNALCAEIGKRVIGICDDQAGMTLKFDGGVEFSISFLPEDRIVTGAESLVMSNSQGEIVVVGDSE